MNPDQRYQVSIITVSGRTPVTGQSCLSSSLITIELIIILVRTEIIGEGAAESFMCSIVENFEPEEHHQTGTSSLSQTCGNLT